MLHRWPNGSVVDGNLPDAPLVDGDRPNDPDDRGNALAGLWPTVLIEVVVGLGIFVVYWVAAALLLHRLASWLF